MERKKIGDLLEEIEKTNKRSLVSLKQIHQVRITKKTSSTGTRNTEKKQNDIRSLSYFETCSLSFRLIIDYSVIDHSIINGERICC